MGRINFPDAMENAGFINYLKIRVLIIFFTKDYLMFNNLTDQIVFI